MSETRVMSDVHTRNKAIITKLRKSMVDFDANHVREVLTDILLADAIVHMPHPFADLVGPNDFFNTCYAPLLDAMPDLELSLIHI